MKKIIVILVLLFTFNVQASQIRIFKTKLKQDTVEYVVVTENIELKKPILFFSQGSLPRPIVINFPDNSWIAPLGNFNYNKLLKDYHIVIVAMPHIAAIAEHTELDEAGLLPFSESYKNDDYLEKYVDRSNAVIKDLRRKPWADSDNVILIGHSQGARVGLGIAASANSKIKALGYFSGQLMGRFSVEIFNDLKTIKKESLSANASDQLLMQTYNLWQNICREGASYGNSSKSWRSFSTTDIDKISKLKIPVFIAYGSEDTSCAMSALAPIYMELNGKHNYFVKPMWGCGHNFEVKENGQSNYDLMYWNDVIEMCIDWFDKHRIK